MAELAAAGADAIKQGLEQLQKLNDEARGLAIEAFGFIVKLIITVIEFIVKGILGLTALPMLLFVNVFSFASFNAQHISKLFGQERFSYRSTPITSTSVITEGLSIFTEVVSGFFEVTFGFIQSMLPILTLAPYSIVLLLLFLLYGFIISSVGDVVIKAVDLVYIYSKVVSSLWVVFFNGITVVLELIAVPWNTYITLLGRFVILVFGAVCPGQIDPLNLISACPILDAWFSFLLVYWELLLSVASLFFSLLISIYQYIGDLICPGGLCSGTICKLVYITPCSFDVTVFMTGIIEFTDMAFDMYLPLLRLSIAFAGDLLTMLALVLTGIIRPSSSGIINGKLRLGAVVINSTNPVWNDQLGELKNVLSVIETIVFDIFQFTVRVVFALLILFDAIICNTFIEFVKCAASKSCYAMANAGAFYLKILGIKMSFDFRVICNAVGLFAEQCSCDIAIYVDTPNPQYRLGSVPIQYALIPFAATSKVDCITVNKGATRDKCAYQYTTFKTVYEPPLNMSALINSGFNIQSTAYLKLRPYIENYGCNTNAIALNCICIGNFNIPASRFLVADQNVGGLPAGCNFNDAYPVDPINYKFVSGDGIWVPCVPGQNFCNVKYSLLPRLIKGV